MIVDTTLVAFVAVLLLGQNPAPEINIDLAEVMGPATQRASGFLFGINEVEPHDSLVQPLKPRHFRMSYNEAFKGYERVTKMKAKIHYLLSDKYMIEQRLQTKTWAREEWTWPGDDGAWEPWETLVAGVVEEAREKGYHIEWEIWNEPNHRGFWQRSRDQFFETWRRAVKVIRGIDSTAIIIGPSITRCDFAYLKDFLHFAQERDVLPDILSWHHNRGGEMVDRLTGDVTKIREYIQKYDIQVDNIYINEFTGPEYFYSPGTAVRFFKNLEESLIAGACRSCWKEPSPGNPSITFSNCRNRSLDGLLTPDDKAPRSIWWAYKYYADVIGSLTKVMVINSRDISAVAGYDSVSAEVNVLIGVHADARGKVDSLRVNLQNIPAVEGFFPSGFAYVSASYIPDSGMEPLARSIERFNATVQITGDALSIVAVGLEPGSAYFFNLK